MTIIAAITRDLALGHGGDMIYHISGDLKRFKQLTMGHPIIMGRRTLQSFPNGPLPGRRNIVVSRNQDFKPEGIEVFPGLDEAISAAGDDAFILGGGQVYAQAMPLADTLEITEIDAVSQNADTYFPEIDSNTWFTETCGDWLVDQRSGVRYRYVTYKRKH